MNVDWCVLFIFTVSFWLLPVKCKQHSNCRFGLTNLRHIRSFTKWRVEAYWTRCQSGVRSKIDGKHVFLAADDSMMKNISWRNSVATSLHTCKSTLCLCTFPNVPVKVCDELF